MPTVSTVALKIKESVTETFDEQITVEGEVTDYSHVRGNAYFKLQDDYAVLPCYHPQPELTLEDGDVINAHGTITIYEERGIYQLTTDEITVKGEGTFKRAFRETKQVLEHQDLLHQPSQPLPDYPDSIGVITSRDGSALHDVTTTIRQRYPDATIYLSPSRVQGDQAPKSLQQSLRDLQDISPSVIIITRGGGSTEDLVCFNDQDLATMIAHDTTTPIITGIGHEDDTTIADLVADHPTATPTQAATQATPSPSKQRRAVTQITHKAKDLYAKRIRKAKTRISRIQRKSKNHVATHLQEAKNTLKRIRTTAKNHYPEHIMNNGYYPIHHNGNRVTLEELQAQDTIKLHGTTQEAEATITWISKQS
jgi:exodeoxyribonuclease VII large subunit